MVLDTSAIAAILQAEPERRAFLEALEGADQRRMSAATWVESSIVIECRYGLAGLQDLDRLLRRAGIEVTALDGAQARLAREAFSRFGKGRHPAGLNFGDCFAYALATAMDEPLLCKGDDFQQTDVAISAVPPR